MLFYWISIGNPRNDFPRRAHRFHRSYRNDFHSDWSSHHQQRKRKDWLISFVLQIDLILHSRNLINITFWAFHLVTFWQPLHLAMTFVSTSFQPFHECQDTWLHNDLDILIHPWPVQHLCTLVGCIFCDRDSILDAENDCKCGYLCHQFLQ